MKKTENKSNNILESKDTKDTKEPIDIEELRSLGTKMYIRKHNITNPSKKRNIYRIFAKLSKSDMSKSDMSKNDMSKNVTIQTSSSKTEDFSNIPIDKEVKTLKTEKEPEEAVTNYFKDLAKQEGFEEGEEEEEGEETGPSLEEEYNEEKKELEDKVSKEDLAELAAVVPESLDLVFKKYGLTPLNDEEKEKLKIKSEIVIKKRVPEIVTEYADIISLGITAVPIFFKRVEEANEIEKQIRERKAQQEAEKKEQAKAEEIKQLEEKPKEKRTIENDPELFKQWQDYAMGKGPRPTEW